MDGFHIVYWYTAGWIKTLRTPVRLEGANGIAVGHYFNTARVRSLGVTRQKDFGLALSSNWIKLAGLDMCNSCPSRRLWPVTEDEEEEEEEEEEEKEEGFKSCI